MPQHPFLRSVVFMCLCAFFFAVSVSFSAALSFSRDLRLGNRGEDVRSLQKILNSRPETQLAPLGIGAPGQETDYFGPLTAVAVKKYQELFAPQILAPLGLIVGTGFVGPATRAHLNGSSSESFLNTPTLSPAPTPRIFSLTPTSGGVGTELTISGEGFLPSGNVVASAFEEFDEVSSPDGKTLTIEIQGPFPAEFLEEHEEFYEENKFTMQYQLVVRNARGVSNFVPFIFTFY